MFQVIDKNRTGWEMSVTTNSSDDFELISGVFYSKGIGIVGVSTKRDISLDHYTTVVIPVNHRWRA